jgi:hypothetical protein
MMVIKKKERILTPLEFKAKQKRDCAPFWINSEVLFGANLYPVDDSFSKQITIIFLLDAADFTTERVVDLMQLWNLKYGKLQWSGVLAFEQKYAFLKNVKFFERFKNQKIFLDTFGELFERFGSGKEPVAVILKNGELVSSMPLLPDFAEMVFQLEQQLQKTLRIEDAGLPLPKVEKLIKKTVPLEQKTITPEGVSTFGEWNGSKDLLVTEKNGAIISVPFRGRFLRLVGMAHPQARDAIKVSITFNEKMLMKAVQTPIIHDDNTGNAMIELNKSSGVYDLIQSETEIIGVVKLTFLNAYDNGAVFYEFKIA